MNPSDFVVVRADRQLACRTGAPCPTWQWEMRDPNAAPPPRLITWTTQDGAQKFASMNGGKVRTVLEHFYRPRV